MKFSYRFSNLLGTVYRKGNLVFSPDGNSIYSPVGNRITVYDLKNNKTQTLGFASNYNYVTFDISPNGLFLACANEKGDIYIINLISKTKVFKYMFKGHVSTVKFSPDGNYLVVLKETCVFVFKMPGSFIGEYKGIELFRVFSQALDRTVCLDWTTDSAMLAVGSMDMTVRLYAIKDIPNYRVYSLSSHRESIIACFFEKDSLDLTSISCDGNLCIWECNWDLDELDIQVSSSKKRKTVKYNSDSEDDVNDTHCEMNLEKSDKYLDFNGQMQKEKEEEKDEEENVEENDTSVKRIFYKRISRKNMCSSLKKNNPNVRLTSAAYHKDSRLLVTGYSSGEFFLHELPSVTTIHSLSMCEAEISAICLNNSGDWIALASSNLGHLLVWEWQSETYVLKQQGHTNNMTCLSYSPDGMYMVTGGYDGKVKLWNTSTGFCFVTFTEHSSNVTAVEFSQNRNFIVSASLDGTVRAFDLIRYRNFKTFTSPTPVQFSCVAIDSNGEFVAAGGQDKFEIYLWSMKIGRLCEILTGHEGPVVGISFNPVMGSTMLASISWDKTFRLWNAVDESQENERFLLSGDGLALAFRPDGKEIATSSLDGQITFFDVVNRLQTSFIEGRNDMGSGVTETDLISAKKNLAAKAFSCLCYTADGSCILVGGHSKNVCIYNVREKILLKKFEITENRSLDNVEEFINRRKMTEFGNIGLVEERENSNVKIRLPGVRKSDMASRSFKPEIRVFDLEFSPTGQSWAAVTTEGLLIYSLDSSLVFDPLELNVAITPETVRMSLQQENYSKALMMAIKLGEKELVQNAIEKVPYSDVKFCVASTAQAYVIRCLKFIASLLENTKHLEFYLAWVRHILTIHGSAVRGPDLIPVLLSLQKNLSRNFDELGKLCDHNKYTIEFLLKIGKLKQQVRIARNRNDENKEEEEEDDEILMED